MAAEYEWLEAILEDTKTSESPVRFKLWSALWTVGAVTKRNVYVRLGGIMKLYPNMYVMLIADSGLGKQFPITMATQLLKHAAVTRVVKGRNSIEAIIETIGRGITLENGMVIKNAEAACISGEFSNLLIDNPQALTILTQLYDTESLDEWPNTLKKGKDNLKNVFLSLLTATNMEHYNDKIQEKDIQGGFIARTICINESHVEVLNSLMEEGIDIDWARHAWRLTQIAKLSGVMKIDDDAQVLYNEWYYPFHKKLPNDKTGFSRRVRAHILKVAMCLSLIESDDMLISKRHMTDAMDLCLKIMDDIMRTGRRSGKSKYRGHYAIVTTELIKCANFSMTRREMLNKHLNDFTEREFNETISTLTQANIVEHCDIDGETGIKLTERCVDELLEGKGD